MFEQLRRRMVRDNRIYIMPSGRGFTFLLGIVVMILTAATYNNNLIFILAFFLFSLFVVTMLQTHNNLQGVSLQFRGAEDAFEGDPLHALFEFSQRRARRRPGLQLRARGRKFKTLELKREDMTENEHHKVVAVSLRAPPRGVHALPEMSLETYWPIGLFRAWIVYRLDGEVVVYPRPEGEAPLTPQTHELGVEETGVRTTPDGDFGELKAYATGESYHQIAWKHYARTGQLLTKVHWGAEHRHYELPWDFKPATDKTAGAQLERYLRQMSRWIQIALEEDASFALETPTETCEPGRGPAQAKACWRALARVRLDRKAG